MTLFENNGAEFSPCGKYRYALWRIWAPELPLIMFIGLNPSTANQMKDDPTIRRVKVIARNLGYGGVYMLNCFPYVSTNPAEMIECKPDSKEWYRNMEMMDSISRKVKDVVFAWGNFKVVQTMQRDIELLKLFPNAKALHINKNGSPKHPLYCRTDSQLKDYKTVLHQLKAFE